MNRSLSPRDRGHRSGDPGGQSRPAGSLPRALRLVGSCGYCEPDKEWPPLRHSWPTCVRVACRPARVRECARSRKARHGSAGRARKEAFDATW